MGEYSEILMIQVYYSSLIIIHEQFRYRKVLSYKRERLNSKNVQFRNGNEQYLNRSGQFDTL